MTATLLRKEWQQHRGSLVLLFILTLSAAGLIGFTLQQRGQAGSIFTGHLLVLRLILPLAAWLLGQRLITLEFREKTQLFLEALPLPRWRLLTVKYGAGLAASLLLTLSALAVLAALGRDGENLDARFLTILATRTAMWTWCLFTFFFATSFLGRYRLLFLLTVAVLYALVDHFTDFRPSQFGPFALVDDRLPFENLVFPVAALRTTALLTLGLLAFAFGLGLVRDGTLGAALGERMSQSEKLFVGAICLGGLIVFGLVAQRAERAPFDLPGATAESRGEVVVKVGVNHEAERTRGAALGARAADELSALRRYLDLDPMPGVFIVLRRDLAADAFERVKLEKSSDLVVRANFTDPKFDERAFLDRLVRDLLLLRSRDRLAMERQAWVLDGFGAWWKGRAGAAAPADLRATARRAAGEKFSRTDLQHWLSFSQRAGAAEASAVAWTALDTLTRRHGEAATRQFLRAVLGPAHEHNALATWRDFWNPIPHRLAAAAGVSFELFFAAWQQDLRAP